MIDVTKENRAIIDRMREVFDTPEGRQVFTWILKDLGTFDMIPENEPGAAAKRNYGIRLMDLTGLLSENTIYQTVDKLFEVPVEERDDDEELGPDFSA